MRNKRQKGRCRKQSVPKFLDLCKTYDLLQEKGAIALSQMDEIETISCNVELEGFDLDGNQYTSDFVCKLKSKDRMVRECVYRNHLRMPKTIRLLAESRRYWKANGISDWGLIVDEE